MADALGSGPSSPFGEWGFKSPPRHLFVRDPERVPFFVAPSISRAGHAASGGILVWSAQTVAGLWPARSALATRPVPAAQSVPAARPELTPRPEPVAQPQPTTPAEPTAQPAPEQSLTKGISLVQPKPVPDQTSIETPKHKSSQPIAQQGTDMDRYVALGRLFADFLEQGSRIYNGLPPAGLPPTGQPPAGPP